MKHNRMTSRSAQRGASSLIVAMILLFGMTMVAFYANRSLLFEQRTSANQYRSTSAFEVAEAGIEWATARLNESQRIDASCAPSSDATDKTFRDGYLRYSTSALGFNPVTNARPGCRLPATGSPVCSCPAPPSNPSLGAFNEPSFTVTFAAVGGDPESVLVTSEGCTGQGTQCVPGSTFGRSDAMARLRVILKLLPALRTPPQSTLTAGGDVNLNGSVVNVTNIDATTNGIAVDAGLGAPGASTHVTTLPGAPREASVLSNDTSLSGLNTTDPTGNAMFRSTFGQEMTEFKADRATTVICDATFLSSKGQSCPTGSTACSGGTSCAAAVVNAVSNAKNQLWIDAEAQFDNGNLPVQLGSPNNPVLIVTPWDVTFNGDRPMYGLLYGAGQNWNVLGGGTANVRGAVAARANFNDSANLELLYDPGVLRKLRPATGSMVRVPGSWRDFDF